MLASRCDKYCKKTFVDIAVLLMKKRKGQPKPDCEKKCVDFPTRLYFCEGVYSYLVIKWKANTDK